MKLIVSKFTLWVNNCLHCSILCPVVLIGAVLVLYYQTLQSPFLFDDYDNILKNSNIKIDSLNLESVGHVLRANQPTSNRNLAYLTFALNYYWGQDNPASYHVVNIVIHLACGVLVGLLFYQILTTGWLKDIYHKHTLLIAWTGALIWATHPIQINAVNYIVQRMTSLSVLFSLITMILWMVGRRKLVRRNIYQAILLWCTATCFWLVALHCKQIAVIVPLLIMGIEFFLVNRGKLAFDPMWVVVSVACFAVLILFYMDFRPIDTIMNGYHGRDFTLQERLLTELRVLWFYVKLFYVPLVDNYSFLHSFSISKNVLTPCTTLVSFVSWILIVFFSFRFRRRWPVFAFVVFWYLSAHLIESTIIPLEIIYEHRMYLPSIALAFGTVIAIYESLVINFKSKKIFIVSICMIIVVICSATFTRNMDYKTDISLYLSEYKKNPEFDRIKLELAFALLRSGYGRDGGNLLEELVRKSPNNIGYLSYLYMYLYGDKKDLVRARHIYDKIIGIIDGNGKKRGSDYKSLITLAYFNHNNGLYEHTIQILDYVFLTMNGSNLWYLRGASFEKLGKFDRAAEAFETAYVKNPDDALTQFRYGKLLVDIDQQDYGCTLLRKACVNKINPIVRHRSCELLYDVCHDACD